LEVKKLTATSITTGKFIAGIVITILASSAVSVGISTILAVGARALYNILKKIR
jgi:zinc transporter ZupT